ncbi:MAG TPA: CocE/NonD family hydrolase [Actinocrinis sp.]
MQIQRIVRIPLDGTTTLAATLYRPVTDEPVPALLNLVPYRRDATAGVMYGSYLRRFAEAGFASFMVDFRGTGASDGTQRHAFDPAEADDGLAAIKWAAAQPWCNGSIGMWGHSYGAITSLRVASRRPPALKAILPVMGMIDPERDFVHPYGHRGALGSVATWGIETLVNQLMPSLEDYGSFDEQKRWARRVHETEPWLIELLRERAGAETWRDRSIDVAQIAVPTFLIAGWRDLFCDGTMRAYDQIAAPKKLLVGPWMHAMPDTAPNDRVDFHALSVAWWDRWLRRGEQTAPPDDADEELDVTCYLQQSAQPWRRYDAWPPKADTVTATAAPGDTLVFSAAGGSSGLAGSPAQPIAAVGGDPTVGSLGGLWNLPAAASGLPLDQHDDDLRGWCCTSQPVAEEVPLVGRPGIVAAFDGRPDRLTVRLTDVDPAGRSTLICTGTLPVGPDPADSGTISVTLDPTAYLLAAGHRLRIALSAADFPRLWPAVADDRLGAALRSLDLSLPIVADSGRHAAVPSVDDAPAPSGAYALPQWSITRDPLNDAVAVRFGASLRAVTDSGAEYHAERDMTARVGARTPAAIHGYARGTVTLPIGETIDVHAVLRITDVEAKVRADITVNGIHWADRTWHLRLDTTDNRTNEESTPA